MPRRRGSKKKPGRVPSRRRKGRKRKKGALWLLATMFKLGFACVVLWALVATGYYAFSFIYDLDELNAMPERTLIYDVRDRVYTRFSGEDRIVVPFEEVSPDFVKALLAREDTRFFHHRGVDPVGIARAAVRNLLMGGIRQGGSTITQQLARNSFPLGGRNYHRKLLEAALSFRLETELTKEEILESYMNRIYFGSGCYGVETAARTYFGKAAKDITLSEAALLAGLIRSPTRLSPLNNAEGSVEQRDVVLQRMLVLGMISAEEHRAALAENLRLNPNPGRTTPSENWAVDAIRRELEQLLAPMGYDANGLNIYTTIDPDLQRVVERSIASRLQAVEARGDFPHAARSAAVERGSSDYLQAAAVVLDHRNGAVLAIAGGRDYATSKFNRAIFGNRQAGSAIKPFLLAHALGNGFGLRTTVSDERLARHEIPREFGNYNPANPDGVYSASRPAVDVVVHSRNPMAVRMALRSGLPGFANLLQRAGLSANPPQLPALALGAFETTLRDMTSAITAFPNNGNQVHPFVVRKITDRNGRVLYEAKQVRTPLLEPGIARNVTEAMELAVTRGTAAGARRLGLRGRAAGKTGTTNAFQDAWFVGFTGHLTAGVWAGFDLPKTIYPGGGGAQIALPIWVDIVGSPAAARYR